MRLATFIAPGDTAPRAGEVQDERIVAFDDQRTTVLGRLCNYSGPAADGRSHALADVTLLAPVAQPRASSGSG